MRIGIDLRPIDLRKGGGINPLLKGVLGALFELSPEDEFLVFCTAFNRSLLEFLPENVGVSTFAPYRFYREVNQIAEQQGLDVLFRSYPVMEGPDLSLSQQIFLVPDIQHRIHPQFFSSRDLAYREAAFDTAIEGAGAIATLSEYSRREIRSHYSNGCQDVFLTSPALQAEHKAPLPVEWTQDELALLPRGDFFLYPANLWPHKNHRRILMAFDRFLKQSEREISFIFTGQPGGWSSLQDEFGYLPIRHLGFVRPQFLRVLYEHAQALIYFSLYEGFGIPLLEAFNNNTPVVCSNTTSLPEVGGDAILSCDPTDVEAMARLMARVVEDAGLRNELVAKGRKRLSLYTWEKSASNLLDAMRRVGKRTSTRQAPRLANLEPNTLPLVSIVTPSFNQGEFIKRTIDSVLNQSYPRLEYIVVDGGSTDGTVEILKSYGNRLQWISEPDRGQSHAINKGFARSHGEIHAYLNSDDVLSPDAVEKVVAFLQQNPHSDLVYGRANYVDEQDQVIGMYNTDDYSFERLMQDCCICQPAAFWRARAADKVGPFNEDLVYAMDYEYWLRVAHDGGQIEHIHDVLASSRVYPETKTLSARREIFREIFAICEEWGGYISMDYFRGLWHHLCWEREGRWSALLRRWPGLCQQMAELHYMWRNRNFTPLTKRAARFGTAVKQRLWQLRSLIKTYVRAFYGVNERRPIRGYWPDDRLSPVTKVYAKNGAIGQEYHLAGIPLVDTTLTIHGGRKLIGSFHLSAGCYETVRFTMNAGTDPRLSLRFSRGLFAYYRRISFQLMDTNLFTEEDTLPT